MSSTAVPRRALGAAPRRMSRPVRMIAGAVSFLLVVSAGIALAALVLSLKTDGEVGVSEFKAEWSDSNPQASVASPASAAHGSMISGVQVKSGTLTLPDSAPTLNVGSEALLITAQVQAPTGSGLTGWVSGIAAPNLPSGWVVELVSGCTNKKVAQATRADVMLRLTPQQGAARLDLGTAGLVVKVTAGETAPPAGECVRTLGDDD